MSVCKNLEVIYIDYRCGGIFPTYLLSEFPRLKYLHIDMKIDREDFLIPDTTMMDCVSSSSRIRYRGWVTLLYHRFECGVIRRFSWSDMRLKEKYGIAPERNGAINVNYEEHDMYQWAKNIN
jgi:hypothetical protein